ncbi:MAG: RNA polymerase sporulation sigma factor SigE [Desulfitobacteriia bacterium]|jgi:RNA polymerase sporulation-specific sigma factor
MFPISKVTALIKKWILFFIFNFQRIKEIFYVGSSEALPPPLSLDEEENLIRRLEKGDLSVKDTLIERNLRLVVYISRKFENTGIGIEDLVSIGTIGLIKAVNTFDPTKRIKLATYASRCIENEILMYLRRNNKIRSEISFDEPLNIDWDGNELLLSDVLGTDNDIISRPLEEEVDKHLLKLAMSSLTEREKLIMELRFGMGGVKEKTQKEVADRLGISQSYISRLEKKIIRRLRKEFVRLQ